jgi:hypothetical protein
MSTSIIRDEETADDGQLTHLVTDLYTRILTTDGTRRQLAEQVKSVSNPRRPSGSKAGKSRHKTMSHDATTIVQN